MTGEDAPSVRCLERYVAAHDECVRTGHRESLEAILAEDAVMVFAAGAPGPFVGREAILRAFRSSPPSDTLANVTVLHAGTDTVLAAFAWTQAPAAGGRLLLTARAGRVAVLVVLPA